MRCARGAGLRMAIAAVGALSACAAPAGAVTVTVHPLPEYQCGQRRCKSGAVTALAADGSNSVLAAGLASSGLYAQVTIGPTLSAAAGPDGNPAQSITIGPDGH